MMQFTVGGESYDLFHSEVHHVLNGVPPEPIRTHSVDVGDRQYPPKQVFAALTGRDRSSFTTLEAQRVLIKLGFICRREGVAPSGETSMVLQNDEVDGPTSTASRVGVLELQVAQLVARVHSLERTLFSH